MTFVGVERLLVGHLASVLGVRVVTELPADLASSAPVVQVVRIGGPHDDDDPRTQIPTVSLDYFAATRAAAADLAEAADAAMRALPGRTLSGAHMGKVRTLTGPSWRPWEDTALRRLGATYQVWLRAPSA